MLRECIILVYIKLSTFREIPGKGSLHPVYKNSANEK